MPKTIITVPKFPNPTAETKKRINEVLKRIRKAQSKIKIIDWLCDTYSISEQQANDYYHDALYKIQKAHSADEDAATIREQQIERIEELMEAAAKDNDRKTVIKCQEMLNKIYQLYVEKQEIDVSLKNLEFKFGDE